MQAQLSKFLIWPWKCANSSLPSSESFFAITRCLRSWSWGAPH